MTPIKEEQARDGNKEDPRYEDFSGSVDVANKAEVDTTTSSSSAPTNEPLVNTSNNAEIAPLIDVAKLQAENTFLKNDRQHLIQLANTELHRLRTLLLEKDTSISVAKKSIAGKQKQLDSLYATLQRQEKKITNQVNEIATLKQKQAAKLNKIRLRMNLMAKRSKKRFERHMAENAYDAREWADQVKALIKQDDESERGSDYEAEEEVDSEDEDEDDRQEKSAKDREMVVIEINDDDEAAGTGQAAGNEQSAVVQQSDTNEQPTTAQQSAVDCPPTSSDQSISNEQSTANEQPADGQQSGAGEQHGGAQQTNTSEQPALAQQCTMAQQSSVTEQPLLAEQTDANQEQPNKRVKLTEEA
ncbi:hypothetical protein KCU85_g1783, partial [Aureobasidium melanogenum]